MRDSVRVRAAGVLDVDAESAVPIRLEGRGVAAGALWLLGSNLAYAGCQWGNVVVLAKLAPAASLGHFGLALAITNPIVMVTGSAVKAFQSSDVLNRYRFSDYVNLRLAANLVAAGAIALIAGCGLVSGTAVAVLVPVAAAKIADATSETCYGVAQKHDWMRYVGLSKAFRGAAGLFAMALTMLSGGSVVEGAWALAFAWAAFVVAVDLRVANRLEPAFARPRLGVLKGLVRETVPLGAIGGVMSATQAVPRYLLQLGQGADAVGYYTALSSVGPVISYFAGALGNASAPRLGWAVASDETAYRRMTGRLVGASVAVSLLLGVLAVVAGRPFLRLAYTPDYADYWSTFVLIAVAAGLGLVNAAAYYALIAARRIGLLLSIQCVGLAVTTVVGFVLVPGLGLQGAALGGVAGAVAMAALGARVLLRRGGAR